MTSVARWVRDWIEKRLTRFYEGPQPPERLDTMVDYFASTNPRATRDEWAEFAKAHARETYRSGYVRGIEYVERDPDEQRVLKDALDDRVPGQLADALDSDWRWSPPVDPNEA